MRLILAYKDFSEECKVSHKGLGNSMAGTSQVLRQHGIRAEIWAIKGGDVLMQMLEKEQLRDKVTHVVIAALFIPTRWLSRIAMRFPEIQFIVNCHSNVGFLQAEPEAIKKVREAAETYTSFHNLSAGANSKRCIEAFYEAYGLTLKYLPNLYNLDPHTPMTRPGWNGGLLRIGAFGACRVQKNFTTAAFAAVAIARQLKTSCELWMNSERTDGNGDVVYRAVQEVVRNVPFMTLKQLPWANPALFKETLASTHLLLQPSYTESFNLTAADAVAMGVPVVVGEAIPWVPTRWVANVDSVKEMAATGRQLIMDSHAPREGYAALQNSNELGIAYWKRFLGIK